MAAVMLLVAGQVCAQDVERAPTPSWVRALVQDEPVPATDAAPIRILAMDQQVRFGPDGVDTYTIRRIRVQTAQGLGLLSTVNASWSPPRETLQVHGVRILRGDHVIDALDGQDFQTLRRENNLESSMLDGVLTATLQPRDLRVGDVLETAFTIHDDGGVLAPHLEMLEWLSSGYVIDHYRARVIWPADKAMRFQGVGSWADAAPRRTREGWELEIDRRDLQPPRLPDDLPARFYYDRIMQFTDFASWSEASAVMAPLYATAETLEAGSPLAAEIERIGAENPTQAGQAAAALRLVQDQVRYVALSMGEGGYVPATADNVWRSRYGDCKGKTALLLALLHGLGIEAVPALVSTRLGDDLDKRLPLVSWFDHIIVRAEIDGRTWWLDGTRVGDRDLSAIEPPAFHWALPVRTGATDLEAIVQTPSERATSEVTVTIDATQGLDAEGKVEMDVAMIGDAATSIRHRISTIPADQLQAMLMSSFNSDDTLKVTSVDSRYDEAANTFHILVYGTTRMAWVSSAAGRVMNLSETALFAPTQAERTELFASYKNEPYSNAFPYRTKLVSRIVLPGEGAGFRLEGGDQTVESGGYRLERTARIADGVAEVVMTTTSLTGEVSAADMAAARTRNKTLTNGSVRLRAPADYRATDADQNRLAAGDSDVDDLIARAKRLTDNGDVDGGLALLDAAIEKDPDNIKARHARGAARRVKNDMAGAREDFDHAVDLDPADVDSLLGQGQTALSDGRASDAVVSYSIALRLDPGNVTGLWGRAAAYYQIGRWERALEDYRALKTTAPDVGAGPYGELQALFRLNRLAEVRAIVDQRLEESATDSTALAAKVRLAKLEGKSSEALPALDAALGTAPDGSDFLLLLRGQARVAAGDEAGARADFAAYRSAAGADPVDLNNLCWYEAVIGFDLDAALADCDAAIAAAGEAGFIDSRAMVLLHLERYAEARADYDQALAAEPRQMTSLYGRGLARLAMGDAAGVEDLEKARARDRDVTEDFDVFAARHPDLSR